MTWSCVLSWSNFYRQSMSELEVFLDYPVKFPVDTSTNSALFFFHTSLQISLQISLRNQLSFLPPITQLLQNIKETCLCHSNVAISCDCSWCS